MNSLTPVTSLARSAAEMVAAAEDSSGQLSDARVATDTVARRAEGILRFVESYREFAQTPDVRRRRFKVHRWAEDMMHLARTAAGNRTIELQVEVLPASLSLDADPELLGQAMLNILRNAVRATEGVEHPHVVLSVARNDRGHCQIDIRDNGEGIPEARRDDIFLPFYTTHKGGSGVGLSFARQVTLAHGGSISALTAPEGGADIRIII